MPSSSPESRAEPARSPAASSARWLAAAAAAIAVVWALVAGAGARAPGEPADVRRPLPGGAVVNWTTLEIEVSDTALGTGVAGRREATEQQVRRSLSRAVLDGVQALSVTTSLTVGGLLREPELGPVLKNRVKQWAVTEAHYYTSGRVHLQGRLAVDHYLRPYMLANSPPRVSSPTASSYTGLVVDARGTGVTPAYCPRLVTLEGDELWSGHVWREVALNAVPARWVSDPAHRAAATAGPQPLVVRASRARGSDLALDLPDAQAIRRHLVGAPALHEGRVVIVIDP